ncbi:hypothetical protein M9435_004040 [Picochlorum sp. BPE23]|nr:hypothetical protein M9435_004040 [Picochlorum sp. BPE23]
MGSHSGLLIGVIFVLFERGIITPANAAQEFSLAEATALSPFTSFTNIFKKKEKHDEGFCHQREYRAFTLQAVKEAKFSGLFRNLRNQTKFEGSDIATLDGKYYVVFDSSMSLGYTDDRFSFRGEHNTLIGDRVEESQFEGIAYVPENETWLLLHESLYHEDSYKPFVTVAKIKPDLSGYDILDKCKVDFELTHENKGFEGIAYVNLNGVPTLLGLCEGNHCQGGSRGRDRGNGKIVVSTLQQTAEDGCVWSPTSVIDIPSFANFQDYAGMAIHTDLGKIAIVSQEDAAVFVSDFDIETLSFPDNDSSYRVYHLPRDNHCAKMYCNVEGIQFLDEYRLVLVSDKAKSKQPFQCDQKDQSIHIFTFPAGWDPYNAQEEQ